MFYLLGGGRILSTRVISASKAIPTACAIFLLGLDQSVGRRRLQTHKQHAGGESNSGTNVVKDFGKINLLKQTLKFYFASLYVY